MDQATQIKLVLDEWAFRRGALNDAGMFRLAKALRWHPGRSGRPVAIAFGLWLNRTGLSKEDGYTRIVLDALEMMHERTGDTPQPIRLDRRWFGKSRSPVAPLDIPLELYIRWFRNELTKVIKDTLAPDRYEKRDRPLEACENHDGEQAPAANDQEQYDHYLSEERAFRDEERIEHETEEHDPLSRSMLNTDKKGLKLPTINRTEIEDCFRRARQAGIKLSRLQTEVFTLLADRTIRHWSQIAEQLGTTRKTLMVEINRLKKKVERQPAAKPTGSANPFGPRLVKKTA